MILKIHNIGKIQNAEIEMRGITVIAGNNNTGKSTYSKILYCMFNAFYDKENSLRQERTYAVENIIFRHYRVQRFEKQTKSIIRNLIEHKLSSAEIRSIIEDAINNKTIIIVNDATRTENEIIDTLVEEIIRTCKVTDEQIQKTRLNRFLRQEFGNKINHVNYPEEAGTISLTIKQNELSASIKKNECIYYNDNTAIMFNTLYIDTPFVLDEINNFHSYFTETGHREWLLKSLTKNTDSVGVIDEILAKERLQRVLSNIHNVVAGEFRQTENEGWVFQEDGLHTPLEIINLSTGMKSFLILKRLIENGEIKEHDVLILDEPEVNLHPEWQLKYAELLVLLQKEFTLNILLTTHSPYFLNAIEVYAQKNGISDKCNYYLTEVNGDICIINEVTENTDLVYEKLAKPFRELENLRFNED